MAVPPGKKSRRNQKTRRKYSTWPPKWRSFNGARAFARRLKLKTIEEWKAYAKGEMRHTKGLKPLDIPCTPWGVYPFEWAGIGDWLGTGKPFMRKGKDFLSFDEAKALVRSLELKNIKEWHLWCKGEMREKGTRPLNIPSNPSMYYRDEGWTGWGDFLGTGNFWWKNHKMRSFKEARAFARNLDLSSVKEWRRWKRGEMPEKGTRPEDIPANPDISYQGKGWTSWGDFLGTGNVSTNVIKHRSYQKARAFAITLNLKSESEWRQWLKGKMPDKTAKPPDIPADPHAVYKNRGWSGWGDFLGTGNVAPQKRKWCSFKKARAITRSLHFNRVGDWKQWAKGEMPEKGIKPMYIPSNPNMVYRGKGWVSWGDFLGTGAVSPWKREWLPFVEARAFALKLRLRDAKEWGAYSRGDMPEKGSRPIDIPSAPDQVYRDKGWKGWRDWIGTPLEPRTSSKAQPKRKATRLREERKSVRRRRASKTKRRRR